MKFLAVFAAILAVAIARPGSTELWSLEQISQALQDPNINPALVPYLEAGLNQIMNALFAGQQVVHAHIPLPAHLAPLNPSPVAVWEPEVAENPAAASGSPLVQLVVNVK